MKNCNIFIIYRSIIYNRDNEKWRNNKVDLEEIIQFPFIIIATPDIPDNGVSHTYT